jgi:glutaredoxin 3
MPHITMYKTPICPYCARAEALLKQKGIKDITVIDISTDAHLRDEMMQKSGGRKTVPQIFIGEVHVGGCDDLYALDKKGELDQLLAA